MRHKHRMLFEVAALSLAVLLAAGCQVSPEARKVSSLLLSKTGSVCVSSGDEASLAGYKTAKVGRVTTDVGEIENCDRICSMLHEDMVERLKKSELFAEVVGDESVPPNRKALLIESAIVDFEEGSRLKRMATLGGAGFIIIRFTLKDAESGRLLAEFNSRAFVRDGLNFGGTIEGTAGIANKKAVEFIKERSGRA